MRSWFASTLQQSIVLYNLQYSICTLLVRPECASSDWKRVPRHNTLQYCTVLYNRIVGRYCTVVY